MKRFVWAAACLALAACSDTSPPFEPASADAGPRRDTGMFASHAMIVTLRSGSDARSVAGEHGINPVFVYSNVLTGFAGSIPDAARAGLLKDSRVVRMDPDREFIIEGGTETNPTWGLDRIDQRSNALDHSYSYNTTGRGVTAYIIDTGIRYSHNEFGGRARLGFDVWGGDGSDCQGHGTHVAGTVGGKAYGVAKEVSLVAVRVLNCSGAGTTSTILAGLDWIAAHATLPAVANMSLGGGADDVVDAAVRKVIAAGVPVVVAAGNSAADACKYSPARVSEAMTIGATGSNDAAASWSNWGNCLDWFAPGVSITSAAYSGDDATAVKSGTSMASPHTAGAAALYLEANPAATPEQVAAALASYTTKGVVSAAFSANNDLLYTMGVSGGGGGTVNTPPTAKFAVSCTDLSCSFTDQSSDSDGSVRSWQWTFGDGSTDTLRNTVHAYPASGTFGVSLTVKDDGGAWGTTSQSVSVSSTTPTNLPPVASFTFSCAALVCNFVDSSTDADGSLVRWEWDFGDGATAVSQAIGEAAHTFAGGGTYLVRLAVTDDGGATTSVSQSVSAGLALSVVGYRLKGKHAIDLTWTGATTSKVALFLNGQPMATLDNTGSYTHTTSSRGQATYSFRLCEVGTTMCSRDETVVF